MKSLPSQVLLRHLREQTRDHHRVIEDHHLLHSLMADGVSEEVYGAVLQVFCHFYTGLERQLMPAVDGLLATLPPVDYLYVPRSPLLRQDLKDLNIFPVPTSALSETLPLPAVDSTGAALGVLYVLEGSTRGGRVIAPWLARSLGVGPARCGRFFSLHVADNRGWLGFLQLLDCLTIGGPTRESAVSAARDSFECLQIHLNAWPRQQGRQP